MKLATAPVNWNSPDVPEYRLWTPYPQLLAEMRAAGYEATEWGSNMPTDPEQLGPDLRANGLRMLGGFVGLELRTPARREAEVRRGVEAGRFFRALGGEYLIAADSGDKRRQAEAGHVDVASGLSEEEWKSLGEGLNEVAVALRSEGVKLVFHNHVGTYVETGEETSRLLAVTDPALVGWCLDCGHLAYGGGDTLRMLERHGDRVGYVHIKDVDAGLLRASREHGWSFQDALKRYIFSKLGQGTADIPAVVRALKEHGYDGWLVVEQDTTPDNPTDVARENRQYLEAMR